METETILSQLTLEEKASLCSGRDFWHTKAVERLGVPSVLMCDGPHGLRKQLGQGDHLGLGESIETTCYPTASALAASFDRALLARLGQALGRECRAEGVGMLLGPGLNIKRSPLCGRNFEYFSEDPYLAGELAAAYVQALQAQGVAACLKHFACNNQETRRMSGSSQLDERTLREIYLPAFETAVKQGGARAVMCAYNAVNGVFAAENRRLLTEILREEWGFAGIVVTDWGAVKDRVKGLEAGLDLEMPGGPGSQDGRILRAVESGALDKAVLDEAAGRLLRFAAAAAPDPAAPPADRSANAALSEELAVQSAVLLKNQGVLPLGGETVAFIGEFAQTPRFQGSGSSRVHTAPPVGAQEAARAAGHAPLFARGYDTREGDPAGALLRQAVEAARAAETAVVFAGLPDSFETEGRDRASLALPADQNALIEAVAAANPRTVVVLHGGAPVELPWLDRVKAVLCMYLGGQAVGPAAVRLLWGLDAPSGKLAETWPVKLTDNPSHLNFPGEDGVVTYAEGVFVGYRYYDKKEMPVLFPFGHGLSYTTFAYSDLRLDRPSLTDRETLTVRCRVKNTGTVFGREAVQLYVGPPEASARRPVRELKGFEKVALGPGEEAEIAFRLDKRAFARYEVRLGDWFVETGDYRIEVAASSRDVRLAALVHVTGTRELPVHFDRGTTLGELRRSARGAALLQRLAAARPGGSDTAGVMDQSALRQIMEEMPLGALVIYGALTEERLEGLLQALNG